MMYQKRLYKGIQRSIVVFLFLCLLRPISAQSVSYSQTSFLQEDWLFHLGDVENGQEVNHADQDWQRVSVPHDWSSYFDYSLEGEQESGFLLGGIGWYRKHFVLDSSCEGKTIRLDFGGIYMNGEVYINGVLLGKHPYGYTPFSFDISEYVVADGTTDNVIAIRVDHSSASSRWYSGSGIIRPVTLSILDAVHVAPYGIQITYPELEKEKDTTVTTMIETNIQVEEENVAIELVQTIYDSNYTQIDQDRNTRRFSKPTSSSFSQLLRIPSPLLWSPQNPNLYHLRTDIVKEGEVVDTTWTSFGYRYESFDREKGYFLNGEPLKIKGVCLHSDYGPLGTALNESALRRQLILMKEMGANAIRVAHNPASRIFLDMCNEMGFLVVEEAFDTWTLAKNYNFMDYSSIFLEQIGTDNQIIGGEPTMTWAQFDIQQMVRQSFNDPCIMMYSIGNEILGNIAGDLSQYPTYANQLSKWVKEIQPNHPVTIADNVVAEEDEIQNQMNHAVVETGGMIGLNYASDIQYDTKRELHPDWILYGSETTSSYTTRDYYASYGIDEKEKQVTAYDKARAEWGNTAQQAWMDVITRDYLFGHFIWTGIDYIGEPSPWDGHTTGNRYGNTPNPKSSYFGAVDLAGFPKDNYYFYQSQWNDEVHTLHVLPHWNEELIRRDSNGNIEVDVYSDASSVELFLNGESLGKQTFTSYETEMGYHYQLCDGQMVMRWSVPYEEGELYAVAYDEQENIISDTKGRSFVQTAGDVAQLQIHLSKESAISDGNDLIYVEVEAIDSNGTTCPQASFSITFDVQGEGVFLASENGNPNDITNMKSNTRSLFFGKAVGIIQTTRQVGDIQITVSSDETEPVTFTISSQEALGDTRPIYQPTTTPEIQEESNIPWMILIGSVLAVLLVVLSILILKRNKKTKGK